MSNPPGEGTLGGGPVVPGGQGEPSTAVQHDLARVALVHNTESTPLNPARPVWGFWVGGSGGLAGPVWWAWWWVAWCARPAQGG